MLPDIIYNDARKDPTYMQIIDKYETEKADTERHRLEFNEIGKLLNPIKKLGKRNRGINSQNIIKIVEESSLPKLRT